MARPIVALALLAMLTIASAERSLLASKYQPLGGSSLHAVAITSFSQAATIPAVATSQPVPPNNLGYFTTNGNGTWVQKTNTALGTANLFFGALSVVGGIATAQAATAILATGAPLSGAPWPFYTTAGFGSMFLPGAGYNGMTSMTFPSKMLGVAVGLNSGAGAITNCPSPSLVPAAACAAGWQSPPNIQITVDQGMSWQTVTGFGPSPAGSIGANQVISSIPAVPAVPATVAGNNIASLSTTGTAATVTSFPNGFINGPPSVPITTTVPAAVTAAGVFPATTFSVALAALGLAAGGGYIGTTPYVLSAAAGAPIATNFPYLQSPDLLSVYCVSRNACFAAGGYMPVSQNAAINTVGTVLLAQAAGSLPTYGQILTSTNGGTQWNYASIPTAVPQSAISGSTATSSVCPANSGLCPVPGLLGISADSSGRHVYAVGAPSQLLAVAGVPYVATYAGVTTGAGVILYSGNSGVSFSYQAAPLIASVYYSLSSVAVLRGTIAVAAGGAAFGGTTLNAATIANAGVIIATLNGGFTWSVQTVPRYNVLVTPAVGFNQVNALAFYASSGNYTGFAVGDAYQMYKTSYKTVTVSNQIQPTQFVWTVASSALPQLPTASVTGAGAPNFVGITWDNNLVGYAYGTSFILSTHNGGVSWQVESPNGLIATGGVVQIVNALATVPTTY